MSEIAYGVVCRDNRKTGNVAMPRGARLDAPGALHHVIIRGIEGRNIVDDYLDRENFINRLGKIALETKTAIYAWALMRNHAHLLLRSGAGGVSTFMRRLLTGHAISYNRRHHRQGHLFQNRYKSIICEEEPYFLELVRYIHLNPLRAGIVDTLAKLDHYPWCGHAVVMGTYDHLWHHRDDVLKRFGKRVALARTVYRAFVENGIGQDRRPELTGGGLIRSVGGSSIATSPGKKGFSEKGDARILGSGEFVQKVVDETERNVRGNITGDDFIKAVQNEIQLCCAERNVTVAALLSGSRRRAVSAVRRQLALKLVNELGLSLAETGRQLGLTTSGVAQILRRKS